MRDLVSIIVLTYNKFDYLFECLDSIFIQNYDNIQLIISDDGSTDFPKKEIENFVINNSGNNIVKYDILENDVNQGTVKNLNKALKFIEGDYIIPLAADDAFYDNQVVNQFADVFKSIDKEVLIITSQVECLDQILKKHISFSINERQKQVLKNKENLFFELSQNCFIPSGGTAYRKHYFVKYGEFDSKYKLIEDWPTFLKISRNKDTIFFSDFISVKHRDGGVSRTKSYSETSRIYHGDLIKIMDFEIMPYIWMLPKQEKIYIQKLCMDKKNIYKFRFEFKNYSVVEKIKFIFVNYCFFSILSRKIIRRFKISE